MNDDTKDLVTTGEACRRYEARLEGLLDDAPEGAADPELAQHLSQCAGCTAALDRARLAGNWLRATQQAPAEANGIFVARVMARIRNEQEVRSTAGAVWVPVQLLASRLALGAGMVLLLLSLYVYKSTPRQITGQQRARVEATGEFPQPPSQPTDKNEVLASLSGAHDGY
ncbi:MAG: hypothetical protein WBF06_06565 [Candidatus Acidiferrales bacterium]